MKRPIAEVAIPISIALNEEFDYLIPEGLISDVSVGSRLLVPFRTSVVSGYCVRLKAGSRFQGRLRAVIKCLDPKPFLTDDLMKLALWMRKEYFCSLGEIIQAIIPIRGTREREAAAVTDKNKPSCRAALRLTGEETSLLKELPEKSILVLEDQTDDKKWRLYAALIKKTLSKGRSAILLVPDHEKITSARQSLCLDIPPRIISSRSGQRLIRANWLAIRHNGPAFILGTRSAVFAPATHLGLIIVDEEDHFAFHQEQVPHYRTSWVALERGRLHGAKVVLGSMTPSLEAYALQQEKEAGYLCYKRASPLAPVRLVDMRGQTGFRQRKTIISSVLEYKIADLLQKKEKMLIFVNKKVFSTFLYCKNCKKTQTCPHCSASLVYSYQEKMISCHICHYRIKPFDLCPQCQSAYVKYSGFGIEKIESEIARLFPSARIADFQAAGTRAVDYDILLATQKLLETPSVKHLVFDTVCVIAGEQPLGHMDFRATEKAFARYLRLASLARAEMLIQTTVLDNPCFKSLVEADPEGFYKQELSLRQSLSLPPSVRLGQMTIRSPNKEKTVAMAEAFYRSAKKSFSRKRQVQMFAPQAAIPFKVRGKYRMQLHLKYHRTEEIRGILNRLLQKRGHDVVTTFDPAPV